MEKLCEFCAALRPVIYCKADAAHLCLSCDAKVHSANALSNRHLRTLLCEFCKTRPTHVHCFDHRMFLCHVCDQTSHEASSHHRKRVIRSYKGCPSAKEFARFWGFDSTEFETKAHDVFLPTSCASAKSITVNLDIPVPYLGARLHSSSLRHQLKVSYKSQEKNTSILLHQILDLERLQLTKENDKMPLIRGEEKNLVNSSEKIEEVFDHQSPNSQRFGTNIQQKDNPLRELNADSLCFPFGQPEFLPSSSAVVNGESLWQCKSTVECSQLWSQNMQDLGVCDDFVCHDDFDIPDVDLTFRNFEELFGGDQDQTRRRVGDEDLSFSSVEKDMSTGRSNNLSRRKEDASMASSGLLDCHGRGAKPSYSLPRAEHVQMKRLGEDSSRHEEKKCRRLGKQIECSSKRWGDDFQKLVKGRSAKLDATRSF